MSHLYFPTEILECFCIDSFKNFGFSEDESKIITDVLLTSDKFGIESHGMQRISRYHKGIQKGLIKVDAVPEVIFETHQLQQCLMLMMEWDSWLHIKQ